MNVMETFVYMLGSLVAYSPLITFVVFIRIDKGLAIVLSTLNFIVVGILIGLIFLFK
jgi:hypothetical protein